MSDDYLWDASGPPDPEVAALEEALAPLRFQAPPPALRPGRGRPPTPWLLLAAGLLLAISAGALHLRPSEPWAVEGLAGRSELAAGEWLETGDSAALIQVADIGTMEVAPDSRLQLVTTGRSEHRLALERGRVDAFVVAPPRLLIVETPAAEAVDLGCAYSLEVEDDGSSLLEVRLGQVALEAPGREVFVPAGASARAWPGRGPGAPVFSDASIRLRQAADGLDRGAVGAEAALVEVLGDARLKDTLTLWHLLPRLGAGARAAAVERIFALDTGLARVGVDRGAVRTLSPGALEALREELVFQWF